MSLIPANQKCCLGCHISLITKKEARQLKTGNVKLDKTAVDLDKILAVAVEYQEVTVTVKGNNNTITSSLK